MLAKWGCKMRRQKQSWEWYGLSWEIIPFDVSLFHRPGSTCERTLWTIPRNSVVRSITKTTFRTVEGETPPCFSGSKRRLASTTLSFFFQTSHVIIAISDPSLSVACCLLPFSCTQSFIWDSDWRPPLSVFVFSFVRDISVLDFMSGSSFFIRCHCHRPSIKTLRIKTRLGKAQKNNKPVPRWMLLVSDSS